MATTISDFGHRWRHGLAACALLLVLSACGGGSDAPPPSSTTIGAAGGTVIGPNGSKVVIPPGALASEVQINIEQTSVGAPALPSGLPPSGAMFAITPHGTTFAIPVEVTLPFDPASTPAGAAPLLYKTNAQNQWEQVANATFGADTVVAQISSFSFGQVVVPPLSRFTPYWKWEFKVFPRTGRPAVLLPDPDGHGNQDGGLLGKFVDFGKAFFDRPFLLPPNGGQGEDGRANGLVAASEDGVTFGAFTEAPNDGSSNLTNIGSTTKLIQRQSFRKNAADASLTFTLTRAEIEATDFHNIDGNHGDLPEPLRTRLLITGQLKYSIMAYKEGSPIFFSAEATAQVEGNGSIWKSDAANAGPARSPLWSQQDFDFSTTPIVYSPGTYAACLGTGASMTLKAPRTVAIDLGSVNPQEEFTVQVTVEVIALNRRGGGRPEDCSIASASAFLKDPQQVDGTTMTFAGLEPTNRPLPPPPQQPLVAPASCTTPNAAAGFLQFEAPAFAIGEFAGAPAVIRVIRAGGSSGEVSARFTTSDGTAIGGVDYTAVDATVFFADGDSAPRFMTVPTIQNEVVAPDKTVNLTLSQPGGCATLGAQSTATLTIIDDTGVPTPTFTVGGTVNGLAGSGLVLSDALGGSLVSPGNGAFTLPAARPNGSSYDVRVETQPNNPLQVCTVTRGVGLISGADVADVVVDCATPPPTGSLDTSFGGSGKVTSGLARGAKAMAVQSDGKLVVLSEANVVTRYNADGTQDLSFGTAGIVKEWFTSDRDIAHGMALQPDGKIVVVGRAFTGVFDDFGVLRLNADGSLDPSFGTGGKLGIDVNGSYDEAHVPLIQPDGKIVVVGNGGTSTAGVIDVDFSALRLSSAGVLDTSFGMGGKVRVNIGGRSDLVSSALLQVDGRILIAGRVGIDGGETPDAAVVRLNANGSLDTAFGGVGNGFVRSDYSGNGGHDEATALALQADGKIVVALVARVGGVYKHAMARLTVDGSPDGGFGTAGLATQSFAASGDYVRALAVLADGRIVTAGYTRPTTGVSDDFLITRHNADGSLDTAFGSAGKLVIDFFANADGAECIAIQPDGKAVAAGLALSGATPQLAIVRLLH